MNDNKQKLYDAISGDYDVGTFDAFSRRLDNENDRRQLYDAISGDYDVGDYDTFSSKLGYGGVTDKGATMKSNAFGSMATWQNPTFGQPQTGAYTPGMGPTLAQAEAVQQENFQAAKNAVKEKAAKAKVSQAMAEAGIRPDLETFQAQTIPEGSRVSPEQREEYLAGTEAMRSDVEQSLEGLGSAAEETLNPDLKQLYGPKTNEQIKEEAFAEGAQMKADEDARKKFYDSVDLQRRDDGTLDLDAISEQAGEKVREYGGLYNYYDKQPMALTPDETKKMVEARYRRDASDLVSKYARLSRGLEQAKNGEASAFWTGFKNNTVEDIFSAGLSSAYDMGILYDIVKRASKGEKLYPEEQQAIVLYGTNQDFLDAVSKDSKWFDIGNGLRTSLELMGQIALTGGTSGATTMSAQGIKNSFKLAQQFAKKYGTKDVLKIAAKEGKKIVPKFTKEGVRNYGRALGNAFVRDMGLTLATPMTFKMLGENMVGLYDFGEGFDENGNYGVSARRNDKEVGEAMWDAYVGSLMERFSESWGGVTDNATDFWRVVRSPKAGGLVGKLSRHLGVGELGWKRAKRMLRTVGVNNIGTETAEEVIGDLGKFALTWDTENLKELLDPDFYTQVAATTVFLGGFGNVISSAAGSMGRYEYDKRKERGYRERLSNYKSAQLDVIPSDNTVDQKAADMQAHLADALEKEQFMDKNADFNNGEVFKAFQDIKDYAAEGEKAYLDGKMSEEDYLAREQLALESQEIIYEGLQRYGGQEALMESLQDDIGEYRNRTSKGQDVIIVRSKDDGSLKYLLDNKGEVAVVRDITGGKDGQPTTMKNTEYEIASVTPAQRYAANVYAVGEDMAKEAAVKTGAADTGVERYNQYQGGQWNPIQTQAQVDEAAAAAQEAQAAEAPAQEAPAAEAPEGEAAQEAAPAAETPAFQPGQTAYLNGEEVEVLGAYNDGQVAVLTEDGRELVDASALSATPEAAPAEESVQPEAAPEAPLEEALDQVAQEQEAPLPMRKNGKIDFNALLEQDPSRFVVEYDKAYGAGKGTEKLLQAQQSLNQQIEKAQKAVETPTDDMNKAADNEDKLQELQARKAVIDAALQPVEEAVEMVDEIVGQQTEAQPVAEESAQTEAPAVEETPAEMTPEAQQNLQQSMDMASGIVNNGPVEATPVAEEEGPAENPDQGRIQESVDMASRAMETAVPKRQEIKEQRKLSDTEAARRRAIRDAVVEKLRKAKIDVITDEKEGQAILRAYRDLWKHAVLHGSGALFDRFDHKFMGSGEGAQYYGWGTYVTEVPGIAKNYARSSAKLSKEDQERREELWDKRAELFSERDKLDAYFSRKQTVDGAVSAIDYLNGLSDERYKILYDAAQSIKAKYSGSWSYPFGVAEQNGDLAIFGFDQLGAVEFLFETQGELYNELRQNPDAFSGIDSVEEFEERLKERKSEIDSKFQESLKRRDEIISELGDTEDELSEIDKRASSYLYEVEIPDDNGNNYITYGKELSPEQKKRLKDAIRERLLADPESGYNEKNLRELNEDLDSSFDNIYGNDVEGTVRDLLGVNDRGASEFLSDLGYVGIKYPAQFRSGGRSDGASNFVIFDENDAKIKSSVKLFKSPDGQTVYGFTKDGKIYLDPEAPADTPIHEYTHLWAEMFRKINPKEWNNVIKLMKGTDLWDAVKRTYPELTDDADIAEEVLAHYSGRRGAQRIEEEMRRIRGDKNMSESEKFKALAALAKLRRAIEKFWKTIAEYLGMEFTTAEEVADRVLADIDKGINPAEVMKKVEVSDRQYAKAKEVLDYFNSKGFKDGQIVRSITDNGVSTYILGSWGLQPYTKYRISDHPIGNYRQQREISFNENTKPETLYRLGSGRNTLSGEEQQKRATGPSEYDQLWDQHKKDMDGLVFRTWQSPLGLDEALKQKAFLANAKYLQQRMNGDGTYTYEFSEPGEQTLDKRPSLEFLRAMEPAKAEEKSEVRMQKEMPKENPVKQKVAEVAKKAQAKVEEAKAIRKAKLDEMDGKIKKVNKMLVAAAQRGYDKATVKTVTDLARELVSEGLIDEAGRKTIKSILSLLSKVAGKENIETSVRRLMDIAAENQIRNLKAYMAKLQKTKAMKVNSSGVKVQGRMDLFGQRMLDEYRSLRDADAKTIRGRLDNGYDLDDDESIARYIGAKLAYRYATGIAALEEAYKSQKADFETKRREMYKQYRDGKITYQAYREFADEGRRSLLQSRLALLDAYDDMTGRLFQNIAIGIQGAKTFKKKEEERKDEIHHMANADMEGTSASPFRDEKKKTFFDRSIPSFLLTPVSSFDMLLRQLGRKSVNGQGYLWNHFLRGAIRASGAEYDAIAAGEKELAAKAQELTGKKHWSDLYGGKDTKIDVMVLQDGELKPMTLTQGNALYIYAVNKMEDGRMKLRAMGLDQAAIDRMMEQVDPKYIKLIDWVQDEFLPKLGKKYAPVYEKLFGAPMDMVENYFPLKIAKGDVEENVDLGHPDAYALPSTMTGAVVRRTKNTKALDLLNADAFDIVLDHLHKMEHWAAFAPLIKDLNTLLSYKRFQNQVKNLNTIYGSGEKLWDEFKKTAEMAVGSYRPVGRGAAADKAAVSISKGVTAAKISFRIFTAIKQLLSMPAYVADANMTNFAKNFVKPAAAWNWCMENLPLFRKRWEGRIAGETRLMDSEFDWGLLKNDVTKAAVKLGISPNAFVDALTVSIGAKSIYETKLKRYLKEGYDKEKAEQLAKEDAQILFNETQQSAEGAFLSSVQLDRTFLAAALSVFRNSSMGYQRQVVDAARNLKHMTEYGYKKEFMDYETKRRMREGVSEEEAKAGAERMYNRAVRHNLVRLAVFGYVLPYFWYMGASLPYFLFGKDDEKKKDMEKEARYHAIAGILEGLSGGNAMSDLWNVIANGNYSKDVQYWDLPSMPVTSDIKNLVQTFARDKVQGYNELINLVVQGGIGVNPQTVTDIINAALDAANGDFNTGREILLAMLKLTQVPQTKLREMYIDELHLDGSEVAKLSIEEIAQRYAQEQVRRNAFLTGFMYGEEDRKKAEKSKIRTFKAKVKERQELLQDKRAAKELGLSQDSGAAKKTLEELMEEVNKAVEQNNRQQ